MLYVSPVQTQYHSIGTKFNVSIQVENFEQFNGWDIHVRSNSSIINPLAFDASSNIFVVNSTNGPPAGGELAHCINGSGTGYCNDSSEGSGIVHSAAAYQGVLQQGGGLLFTITYNVTGFGFSDIAIFEDQISNGSYGSVSHTTNLGIYGNKTIRPDFILDATPSTFALTLARLHSVSQNVTITLTSIDNFNGQASLQAQSNLVISFVPSTVFLSGNGTASSTLIVTASNTTQSTQYFVNVTGSVGTSSHSQILSVRVNPIPDFIMSVTPSILKIHATNSGSSIITLDTQSGFSGSIHLKMDVPPGLVASIGATDFNIRPGQPANTVFAVRTPASDFPFKYLINITASSSQSSAHVPFTITVRSPSPDFNFQISGPGFVIQEGQTRSYTLNVTSVDYFRGEIFLLAFSLSGMKESFTRPSVALEYGNSSTTQVVLTTDPFLAPGNHFMNLTALGTSFLGASVNHTITETITVVSPPAVLTILGLQPVAYFGVIGALWIGVVGAAIKVIRKPKQKRFLT